MPEAVSENFSYSGSCGLFLCMGVGLKVLDLMVRMLGFSDDDKQRIGVAQQQGAGKGVVRGVLGLPGRLVGGIWGGGSGQLPANAAMDSQVFNLSPHMPLKMHLLHRICFLGKKKRALC